MLQDVIEILRVPRCYIYIIRIDAMKISKILSQVVETISKKRSRRQDAIETLEAKP
jgi:hypothetical protein